LILNILTEFELASKKLTPKKFYYIFFHHWEWSRVNQTVHLLHLVKYLQIMFSWGVRYLTRDNLKVVWAKFSTLKLGHIAILHGKRMAWHAATSIVENSTQGLSCQLKFSLVNSLGFERNVGPKLMKPTYVILKSGQISM